MQPRLIIVMCITAAIGGCAGNSKHQQVPQSNSYRVLADEFVAGYLAWRPQSAVAMGLHEFDGKVENLSRESIEGEHQRLRSYRKRFESIDPKSLDEKDSIQCRVILASIDDELMSFEVLRSFTRNPMTYAGAIDTNIYAKRNFAPKPQRLASVVSSLKHMPAVMQAARANLEDNLPRVYVQTAILIADGGADFLEKDLVEAFNDVDDKPLQVAFVEVNQVAIKELRAYSEYLKTEKLPKSTDNFAIGREGFVRMLRGGELIEVSPEQILEIGMKQLREEQAVFARTAAIIDPSKAPIEVFKEIQGDHPSAESLLPDTRQHLEMIRKFVVDRDLVSFPSDVRVIVDETPKYERATSFASMDTPGPFETKATEAYYYVTPVEPHWDAKKREEWLTAFNYYTTDVVSIHEAWPGHYVQFLHLQASKADRIDKIFDSYAFVEGWAHYCEQMALDEGFGADQGKLIAAKYRLAQSDEALLRQCRLCVAIKMHCQGMSVDEATKFFMDNCYYEQAPSRSEAERGTYDPGYCMYTIGKLQMLKLREDWRKQEGGQFSLKRFHDDVLNHGAPPVRLLREIMLRDRGTWDQTLEN